MGGWEIDQNLPRSILFMRYTCFPAVPFPELAAVSLARSSTYPFSHLKTNGKDMEDGHTITQI